MDGRSRPAENIVEHRGFGHGALDDLIQIHRAVIGEQHQRASDACAAQPFVGDAAQLAQKFASTEQTPLVDGRMKLNLVALDEHDACALLDIAFMRILPGRGRANERDAAEGRIHRFEDLLRPGMRGKQQGQRHRAIAQRGQRSLNRFAATDLSLRRIAHSDTDSGHRASSFTLYPTVTAAGSGFQASV